MTLFCSVVTGIKFVESNKAIYPQIQVGKLLPMATIDQNSLTWLDPPDDSSYFTFGYDRREMRFGDPSMMRFTDALVTGMVSTTHLDLVTFNNYFPI
jgi:hypothetical protein